MMRGLVFASLLTLALPAPAQLLTGLKVTPTEVSVAVGETTTVHAYAILGCCSKFPWHVTFGADSNVATVEGLLDSPKVETDVKITGRSPGTTALVSGSARLATVHVYCGAEPAVTPVEPFIVTTTPDRPVTLTVAAPALPEKMFTWYVGRAGDTSQPIPAVGSELAFVPETYGTHYVWVSAASACATSAAEFRIEAVRVRRRSAR